MESYKPNRILVVDDSSQMRNLLGRLLAGEGCVVAGELSSGDTLLATVESLMPDIVFLDYNLPGRNGLDLLKELRGSFPEVAVVMITGEVEPSLYNRAVEMGTAGFLTKPFTQDQFSDMMKQVTYALSLLKKRVKSTGPTGLNKSRRARAVIADDSSTMRKLLSSILKEANIEVVAEAVNGKEAVEFVEKHHPDLVCLDVEMPVMNGLDALTNIRAMSPSMIVLMVTSMNGKHYVVEAASRGAQGYIVKPYQPNKVISQITTLLDRKVDGDTKERRKHPRISIDLPITARLSGQPGAAGKMIELSESGARLEARLLSPTAPEINSEIEVCFNLASGNAAQEIRLVVIVRYLYEVLAAQNSIPGYPYLVGVEFMNPKESDRLVLENFVMGTQP